MSREGIEPFGATARFCAACFTDRRADHDSNKVRLVRFELTRPKAHDLSVVRPTKLRHSRSDSAGPIRTDKRENLSLAAFPISVTAPQVPGAVVATANTTV